MPFVKNPTKQILRISIKNALNNLSMENKQGQSVEVTKKILLSEAFKNSQRISIYLSTENEVNTIDLLQEMFRQSKQVFVPTYQGDFMEMVRLNGMEDYEGLPLTKWNIKQPEFDGVRENALATGGLDLFILPGVGFSMDGGRLGHGRGYYDKYLQRHFDTYPDKFLDTSSLTEKLTSKKTLLVGLAFKEQIVSKENLPLDLHDFLLDWIVTSEK